VNPTVRLGLGVLALLLGLVTALQGHALLFSGLLVLACGLLWGLADVWRTVLTGALVVGLGFSAVKPELRADPWLLPGAAALLVGVLLVLNMQGRQQRELSRLQIVVRALEKGSADLADSKDTASVIRAGVQTLDQLQVAPHLAFVAYRRGTPHVLGSRGEFNALLGKPIQPGNGDSDSRSVQADHWVAEEALSQISREHRKFYMSVPVEGLSGQQLGLLLLARPAHRGSGGRGGQSGAFQPGERDVVLGFARLLGLALGQWQAIRELRDANELTLRSLGAALEHRDDETGGHTARVVALSEQLARRLGWKEDAVKSLRWGAYLHDLGKLAIPDAILHKPGTLTDDERRVIQRHTTVGYDMLQDLHFLPAETLDLVRYHHERWDGTGYPNGLRHQDIPSTARVFSIVDVYDALTSARPYKSAWSRERALSEIKVQGGRQFDPQFVETFVNMMTEQDDARLVR